VMGFLSLVVNVAPVLGPLLGGLFIEGGHWRWIFLVNVPLGIAVAVVALLVVPDDPGDPGAARSDLKGLGLLSPGFALVLLAIERIGVGAAWWQVAVTAVAGAGLLVWYVARARRVPRPVVDPAMFAHRGFASSVGVMALVGFLMYSQLVALPLYARDVHQREGVGQGVLVTALGVGLLVSMALASRASDVLGPRRLVGPGSIVTTAGLVVVAIVQDSAGLGVVLALFVVIGLGFGAVAAPTFSSVYRTVPPDRAGQATTTMFIVVQTSASFGVTVIGLLMSRLETESYGLLFTILAVDAGLIAAFSRLLPGAPQAVREPEVVTAAA
jgi:MFS family permease